MTPGRARSRRAFQGAVALIAAVLLVTSQAPSARAADVVRAAAAPTPLCEPLQLCLYSLPNEHGELQVFTVQPQGTCLEVQPSLKSQVSSITNRTDQFVTLFAGDGCTGASDILSAGVGYPNLQIQEFDNKIRSIRFDRVMTPTSDPCGSTRQPYLCMYENARYTGEVQVISTRPVGTCVDLQPSFKGRVSSLKNQLPYQDLAFFAGDGCTGASYTPGTVATNPDLSTVSFDNLLRSVRFLQQRPNPDPCANDEPQLCLYEDADFAGAVQAIGASQANTCVRLQPALLAQVSSLRNNMRTNVKLYSDVRCATSRLNAYALDEVSDLSWYDLDDEVVAVKFAPPTPPTPDICNPDNLCLFADANYGGERQVISEDALGTCVNLQSTLRGKVSAVENRSYGMVLLFAGDNCTGASDYIDSGVSYHDLTVQGFDNLTRSVRYS